MAILRASDAKTVDDVLVQIRRKKDREWLRAVLHLTAGGVAVDEALESATRSTYPALRNRTIIMDQAMSKLHQPDICTAMEQAFAVRGFTLEDAIDSTIKHIKGEHTREHVLKNGDTVSVPIPPSYAALQGYMKLVIPAQTTKVQIDHTNMNDMLKTIDAQEQDALPRTVGDIIDVDPGPDEDSIDPFEDEDEDEEDEQEDDDDNEEYEKHESL